MQNTMILFIKRAALGAAIVCGIAAGALSLTSPAKSFAVPAASPAATARPDRPKKIYAHYMGCWPAGTGSMAYERSVIGQNFRHEVPRTSSYKDPTGKVIRNPNAMFYGGHVRNYDLTNPKTDLTAEQSADLEIRRAMRIGIDGFAIDAWAGSDEAKRTLDTLFKVAEQKNYPFELTVCIDPVCGGDIVDTVKELLAKHGNSNKLAKRDGKPLIFGYQSWCESMKYGAGELAAGEPADRAAADKHMQQRRSSPEGWEIMGRVFEDAQKQVGQPIFYQYCLSYLYLGVDGEMQKSQGATVAKAAGVMAKHIPAFGGFGWLGEEQKQIGEAVRAAGAEWGRPVGMFQKENIPWESYGPPATDWTGWASDALEDGSTLLQLVTWNDYGENTNIAPGWNTRYTLYDLTRYQIKWWKDGKEPAPDHDRVYLTFHKYPKGSKVFPFHDQFQRDGALEVVSILPKPATIRLPGRDAQYEAPAGFFRKQFPLTPGPVIAELLRGGKVEMHLDSPEHITDKPFREDNGMACFSSEDQRLWTEDFGPDVKPFWYSEYGDIDNDGLPNWFEMYWFGKWLDFSTATIADPKADPNGNGVSNLDEYKNQTQPVEVRAADLKPKPPGSGIEDLKLEE